MSLPNIPDLKPLINLNREDIINLLLISIALEELGLAHIINAEAQKIQSVMEHLKGQNRTNAVDDLLKINYSAEQILRKVIYDEVLLLSKFENILKLIAMEPLDINIFSNTATAEGFYNKVAYAHTDVAYYHTNSPPVDN